MRLCAGLSRLSSLSANFAAVIARSHYLQVATELDDSSVVCCFYGLGGQPASNTLMSQQKWLRKPDLNRRPSGYEPDELPTALFRNNAGLSRLSRFPRPV